MATGIWVGYGQGVRAIRRFTVRPVLPEPLHALGELAGNLRWSWHPPTQDLFAAVDDVLTGKAPSVPAPRGEPVGVVAGAPVPAPGVYTAPGGGPAAGTALNGDFVKGAVFGAVVALLIVPLLPMTTL